MDMNCVYQLLAHPFDTVKTRQQVWSGAFQRKNLLHFFKPKSLQGLYQGIIRVLCKCVTCLYFKAWQLDSKKLYEQSNILKSNQATAVFYSLWLTFTTPNVGFAPALGGSILFRSVPFTAYGLSTSFLKSNAYTADMFKSHPIGKDIFRSHFWFRIHVCLHWSFALRARAYTGVCVARCLFFSALSRWLNMLFQQKVQLSNSMLVLASFL